MKQPLAEKYRPSTIEQYIFHDDQLEVKANQWVNEQEIPNLFFFGSQGTGKSTIARIIIKSLEDNNTINSLDVKRVNASSDNGVDLARRIEEWVGMRPMGKFKVVYLEEADQLTPACQKALRAITEDHSDVVRFIMTANYPKQMNEILLSRFEVYELSSMDSEKVMDNIINILGSEEIDVDDIDILMEHINKHSPDERAILNSISRSTMTNPDGTKYLSEYKQSASGSDTDKWVEFWYDDIEFQPHMVDDIMLLTDGIDSTNFEVFYETLYQNARKFGNHRKEVVIILSQMLARSYQSANYRLNIESCIYMIEAEFMGDKGE